MSEGQDVGEAQGQESQDQGGQASGGNSDFTPITSQDQFDRRIQERIARVKKELPSDYEDLKAAKARLDELEAQNKSELEKAQERIAQLEADAKAATETAQAERLRSAVLAEAAKRNVVDPEAAYALLDRSLLEFAEDGQPKNIASAMDALLEDRAYLVAPSGGSRGSADQGARQGGNKQLSRDDLKSMTPEQVRKATAEGRLTSLATGQES